MANTAAGLLAASWGELIADGLVELSPAQVQPPIGSGVPKPSALGRRPFCYRRGGPAIFSVAHAAQPDPLLTA